jgi:hypothetical protein
MATHSFNVFIGPNRRVAGDPGRWQSFQAEAGKAGHETRAVQMIGGSTPMQHWNQGEGDESKNIAKHALRQGGVDVFTMSPNARMPEDGIDLFGDFVRETNPQARILAGVMVGLGWDRNHSERRRQRLTDVHQRRSRQGLDRAAQDLAQSRLALSRGVTNTAARHQHARPADGLHRSVFARRLHSARTHHSQRSSRHQGSARDLGRDGTSADADRQSRHLRGLP